MIQEVAAAQAFSSSTVFSGLRWILRVAKVMPVAPCFFEITKLFWLGRPPPTLGEARRAPALCGDVYPTPLVSFGRTET
jgi:hypothetical protein